MKRVLFLTFFLAGSAFAASANEPRHVQVTGEGEVKVEPDEVHLQFGIQTEDRSLVKAKDDSTTRTKNLMDVLKKAGIPAKDIQTGYIQINPRYDYAGGRQTFAGYTTVKQVHVILRDLNNYGKILNSVVNAGVEHVSGLQFGSSKTEELKKEARKKAIADAKSKAEMMAAELNQKVGLPLMIQENGSPSYQPMARAYAFKAMETRASPEDTLAPGEMTVTASVTVKFQLQ